MWLSDQARFDTMDMNNKKFILTVKENTNVTVSKTSKGNELKNYYGITYIDDVVEGIILVMQHAPEKVNGEDGLPMPPYKIYNIGNNEFTKTFVIH